MKKNVLLIVLIAFASLLSADQTAILENQKSEEVKKQASGDYPELKRELTIPLSSIQSAWNKAPSGAGVYIVNFDPRETIKITVREYMTTSVIFPPWEAIENIIVGDENNYQVLKPKENIITIRPTSYVGLDTSVTMIGQSGHVYGFYVRTEGYNSENISDITVRVNAPSPLFARAYQKSINSSEKTDYLEEAFSDSSNLNFKFSMSGDETIAPDLVYSDGVRTWFDYGDKLDERRIPTFYKVVDGYQQAINVTLDGTRLIAEGSGSFVLKSGDRVTCIYPTKA